MYGEKRCTWYSLQSGRVLCTRCIVGYEVVHVCGQQCVPVLFQDMMLWVIVDRGVLISIGPWIAYPFYCG